MKTIISLLALGFLVITFCLFWLWRSGVSIRTQPIIKPSLISDDSLNIGNGTFLRLFPDIQQTHYMIWNLDQNSGEVQKNLAFIKEKTEKELRQNVTVIYEGPKATPQEVSTCPRPCWILFPPDAINELAPNPWLDTHIRPLGKNFFTISWISFRRQVEVPENCTAEKRLDLECLKLVSVREVKKYIKESGRYFFMRKYLEHDYFLFVESPAP